MINQPNKEEILQAIARGWCSERNKNKEMDSELAQDIANEIFDIIEPSNRLVSVIKLRPEHEGSPLVFDLEKVGGGQQMLQELSELLALSENGDKFVVWKDKMKAKELKNLPEHEGW